MSTMAALLATILFSSLIAVFSADISSKIGVNYGRKGVNLPSPYRTIETVRSMNVGRMKLYDSDHEILKLLSGTNIHVSTMIPNNDIIRIASSQAAAEQWVQSNVLNFYPDTMIRFVLVGNEVLSHDRRIWPSLVPAMRRIKNSLNAHDIKNIKVSTPLAMDVLQSTFPPSSGEFRSDIRDTVMAPFLGFLNGTKSFFFIDAYPYLAWSTNSRNISLDFALFRGRVNQTDHKTGLVYTNLLDQMLDSVIFAMRKLGYPGIRLTIGETGWPTAGDADQVGANINNAATYNRKLIQKMTAKPALGTPARPGAVIPTFIFSLYDENQKPGPTTERHWGLLRSNGMLVYDIDITGRRPLSSYKPLPAARNNVAYRGKLWCEVAPGADASNLTSALAYACRQGNQTCAALSPGQPCYEPVSVFWHASYAFSSYWSKFRKQGATCYFNGLARQTRSNPSRGHCNFPSVTL
ncbi:putative glucan endo-1,3-beta-glucosidase A6 [Hibiscus syriacus]|uniref:glucan endo-1,3-beta-D-glucosidase n=1 Tax=Hibiscus syriacus TaxID=106335 RepID=A0A6A2YJL0_HIBSY|nr:probable glucan endo-1,3-beta-glucosidase A6 [Hibiscus syriacus]KAE8677597.1 putative glucan endo-1,3-beta-glucosidase A6 [Hibiscus syriacus]